MARRWDLTGLLWDDYKPPKEKVVRVPPEPIWLLPDYLPGLAEARAHKFDMMTDADLMNASDAKHKIIWDTEYYNNYALIGGKDEVTGKIVKFELHNGDGLSDRDKLLWMLRKFTFVGFNDTSFDIPMVMATLAGKSTQELMFCVEDLIGQGGFGSGMRAWDFYKKYRLKPIPIDNIDLIGLTPLSPSLKLLAGRLHTSRMADLPFKPGTDLSPDQITILNWYWSNDLDNTHAAFKTHADAIALRETITKEYKTDVRSKSDPQVAEEIIRAEIRRITGKKYFPRAEIEPGRSFKFRPAGYVSYKSPTMQWVLNLVRTVDFVINNAGGVELPPRLSGLDIVIGETTYRMGIGGLHSQEKGIVHLSSDLFELSDNDVTGYYPNLILQQGMYPPHIGPIFLQVFEKIVRRREFAKANGDKKTAETLKIVTNGTFGKTGERGGASVVYYPEMMIQTTLSGQLAILMVIETLEMNGIQVVSANTDGIVVKCPRDKLELKAQIIKDWEHVTGLNMETKNYKALYSRDVNNYIALYEKPDTKETGAWQHAKAIGAFRKTLGVYPPKWNPKCDICSEAAIMALAQGVPVETTIRECTDVRKFLEVRQVKGMGAYKDGEFLGKAIRWYYSIEAGGPIVNALNGNFIPRSEGARPAMVLPDGLPADLDYAKYIERAYDMIDDLTGKENARNAEFEFEDA